MTLQVLVTKEEFRHLGHADTDLSSAGRKSPRATRESSASGVRVGSGSSAGALVRNAGERAVEEAVENIQNESNKRRLQSGADMAAITADINAKASKRAGAADVVSATRQIIGAYQ